MIIRIKISFCVFFFNSLFLDNAITSIAKGIAEIEQKTIPNGCITDNATHEIKNAIKYRRCPCLKYFSTNEIATGRKISNITILSSAVLVKKDRPIV